MRQIILTLILAVSINLTNAQTYTATQDINVRNGPGTKFQTLGTLSNGETVEVLETTGKWGKISYQDGYGYISTKYLQAASASYVSDVSSSQSSSSGSSNIFGWIIGLLVFGLLLKFFGFRKILGTILPETAENIYGKFECTSCGRTSFGRNKKECPNGGQHQWYKI